MADPVVELQSGLVRGAIEKHEEGFNYYAFKGIPYAEPPLGELRFQDPVPITKWSNVIDCKNYGPKPLQYNFFFKTGSYSEDCLHLNVFTRSINENNVNNPVMVIIHGGGFVLGSADDFCYGPEYLIRKDVVLVLVEYRLGVLGFLNLEDKIAPGNQGLKDQVLALQWVQQNIRVFGGDPNNVTIFGTAAGGCAAQFMAMSPLAKGLMHKVICQGSGAFSPWAINYDSKSNAMKLCSLLGKYLVEPEDILNFLKTVDTKMLQEAQEQLRVTMKSLPFGPGVDSTSSNPFMPDDPNKADNQVIHLPMLAGYNDKEGLILLIGMPRKDFFKMCNENFDRILKYNTKSILSRYNLSEKQIRRLYYKSKIISDEYLDEYVDFASDFYFCESVHRVARVQAENSSAPTYLYHFCYDPPNSLSSAFLKDTPSGACHLDDLPYIFKMRAFETLGLDYFKNGTKQYKVMEQLTEMWTNFAKYGRPTIETSDLLPVHWLPLKGGTILRYLNIDEDLTMQTTLNIDQKLMSAKYLKV